MNLEGLPELYDCIHDQLDNNSTEEGEEDYLSEDGEMKNQETQHTDTNVCEKAFSRLQTLLNARTSNSG